MTQYGIECPFCGAKLQGETYRIRKGYSPTFILFCDNDACKVKPSTIDTYPTLAFADVNAWGKLPSS